MIPNPTSTEFILLILGVLTSVAIMFLPALYELKNPRDAGPRRIMNDTNVLSPEIVKTMLMTNMEEDYNMSQTVIHKILDIIAILPNLEA
jgi:hypothetical protein